jgi:eukaryotic-like serine/threonine-protein kinase
VQVDPDEWATLSQLLDEALDVSSDARENWLETLPPAHATYKTKLRALLRHDVGKETRDFRDVFPELLMGEGGPEGPLLTVGATVGPYVLEEEIGRGGMGVVWRARRSDGGIKRPVALKLPHMGHHRQGLIERFESERDILAQLSHPNIARLYDAGCSAHGQPYLALEYVGGVPLTNYCDRHELDVPRRLRLFQQVLRAVQYAHGHLVIHRDLKPTNVIVGADGRAMLLDFGIAGLMATDCAAGTGHPPLAPLTPDYASPEQVRGQSMTTASDIYSLGVLLFELLTGRRPYDLADLTRAALEEAILKVEPLPPSQSVSGERAARARGTTARALSRMLRGDLDTIVLKALEKKPAERYASADALLQDIEQYLRGEPVAARSGSGWYRAGKFVTRHRFPVLVGTTALAALLLTASIAVYQARFASMERDRAVALSLRSEAVAEFLDLLITDAGGAGRRVSVSEMLARSEALANSQFRNRPEHRAAVLGMLGSYYHTSGKDARAEPLLREALAIIAGSPDSDLRRKLTCSHALSMAGLGQVAEAREILNRVVADPEVTPLQAAQCLEDLAYIAQNEANGADALKYAALALTKLREVPNPPPVVEAVFLGSMGYAEHLNGRNAAAEQYYARSLEEFTRVGHEVGPEAISVRNNWAIVSDGAGNPRRALALYDETLRLSAQADSAAIPPPYLVSNRAHALEGIGRFEEARRGYAACGAGEATERTPALHLYCTIGLASVSLYLGDVAAAEGSIREAEMLLRTAVAPGSPWSIRVSNVRARIALKKRRWVEARAHLEAALSGAKDAYLAAATVMIRAELNLLENRLPAAQSDAQQALSFAESTQGDLPHSSRTGLAWLMLGQVFEKQGNAVRAHEAFLSAVANLSNTVDADHPMLVLARDLAGDEQAGHASAPGGVRSDAGARPKEPRLPARNFDFGAFAELHVQPSACAHLDALDEVEVHDLATVGAKEAPGVELLFERHERAA